MSGNISTERTSLSRAGRSYREAAYRGWIDAIAGVPYPLEYDGWDKHLQLAYESARLVYANIRAAGFRTPWWNGSAAHADGIESVGALAARKIGSALPDERAA